MRPSGTEPLMRVFAESKQEAAARALCDEATKAIDGLVREVAASGARH